MSGDQIAVAPAGRTPLPTRLRLPSAREERLYFAQVREDPLLELEIVRPGPGETVVVVSSGGCTALSLLARGAGRVIAVDRNAAQNHLVELKAAAAAVLGSQEAVAFLGGAPQEPGERRRTYDALRAEITPEARAYWDARPGPVGSGVLRAGASERFIALVTSAIRWAVHSPDRVARLMDCATLAEQQRFYEAEWDTWRWRGLFRLLLNRWCFRHAYDPAFFRHVENPSFARHFLALARHALTEVPVATNYFLHEMLTGQYPIDRPGGLPPYLDPAGTRALGVARPRLTLVDGDYTDTLRGCPDRSIHAFALSNICEWLAPPQVEDLFAEVVRTAVPGARLCFRNFVGWTEVPERYHDQVREDRARGEALMRGERSVVQRRFAVCRVHPQPRRRPLPHPEGLAASGGFTPARATRGVAEGAGGCLCAVTPLTCRRSGGFTPARATWGGARSARGGSPREHLRCDALASHRRTRGDRSPRQLGFATPRPLEFSAVREARPEDNAALIALAAGCPMEGDPSLCVHREPDFFALNRLEGEAYRVGVVDAPDGSLAGCVAVTERHAYLHGRPARLFYASDLKVHPAHRGRGVADALIRFVRDTAEGAGGPAALVFLTVLAGNRPMERLAAGPRGLPRVPRFAVLRAHALPLLFRRSLRGSSGLCIRPGTDDDFEEMVELWGRVAPLRQLAPVYDPPSFAAWIARAPDLEARSFWLARGADGRLAGFLALWDQHRFKQLRVARYSPRLRVVRAALNLALPVVGAPRLPREGAALRSLTVTHICVPQETPEVLRALLTSAYNTVRAAEHSLVTLGLDLRDPLAKAVGGWLSVPTDVGAHLCTVSGGYDGPALDDRPLHYEIALV